MVAVSCFGSDFLYFSLSSEIREVIILFFCLNHFLLKSMKITRSLFFPFRRTHSVYYYSTTILQHMFCSFFGYLCTPVINCCL